MTAIPATLARAVDATREAEQAMRAVWDYVKPRPDEFDRDNQFPREVRDLLTRAEHQHRDATALVDWLDEIQRMEAA